MKQEVTICDRCRKNASGDHGVALRGSGGFRNELDLCPECYALLARWLERDNATVQGDGNRPKEFRGPGWREVCPHHVPCGGPCPTPHYERT